MHSLSLPTLISLFGCFSSSPFHCFVANYFALGPFPASRDGVYTPIQRGAKDLEVACVTVPPLTIGLLSSHLTALMGFAPRPHSAAHLSAL